jgi:PAS domain S-box-containing protein
LDPILFLLAAFLLTGAVVVAFRQAKRHWGWAAAALGMALAAASWLAAGLGWPAVSLASSWAAVGAAVLSLLGMTGLREFLDRQDAAFRSLEEARLQTERVWDQLLEERRECSRRATELTGFLRTLVEASDIWIDALDMNLRVRLWNHAAEAISGYGREEVLDKLDIWEWLYPDPVYRAEVFEKTARILRRGEVVRDLETTIRAKDGHSRIVSWHSMAVRDEYGETVGSVAIGRDVTELRKAELEFQRVHALQNLILEHNVLGMVLVRERRIEWANSRAAELAGIPPREFIGVPARAIYPDEATCEDVGTKAYPRMASGAAFDHRLQLRRHDGQHFWCRLVGLAVDTARPHAGSVWLAEDITGQVAAEASLRESEARFRGAFEGTQDAMLLTTPDGVFDCNRRALDLYGFEHKSEIVRLHPWDLSPACQPGGASSRLLAMKHIQTALDTGSDCFQWEHRHQNGELFPAEVLLSTFSMGRRKVIQASVRDLRDRLMAGERDRERESWFRRLFESSRSALMFLDTRTREFVDFNQAALDLLRCGRGELDHVRLEDLMPEFQPDGSSSLKKGLEMNALAIQNGTHRFRWVHRSPHRGDFPVEVSLTSLQPGSSPLLFATLTEITPEE